MATVVSDVTASQPDGSTIETITYSDGSQSVQYTPATGTAAANAQTLQTRAAAALTANATYLAVASPTTAQAVAQVASLTRQVDALVKLALGQFADTTGT